MKIQLHSWSMSVDMHGDGIPLLFIHGYPLSRKIWEPQVSELATHARVILPDLRGHGDSDPVPGPYNVGMLATDCADLLNMLDIMQPIVVCGLSMGGYIAFEFLRRFPERIAGLIFAATRAAADTPDVKLNRENAIKIVNSAGVTAIVDSMLPKMLALSTYTDQPNLINYVRSIMANTSVNGIIGVLNAMIDRPDSTPMLSGITRPVLIVHGNADQLIPISEAHNMNKLIPESKLVIIEQAGHLLNLEQPRTFNQAVSQFLEQF